MHRRQITRFHHGNTRTVMFTEKLDCLLVSKLGYKKSLPFLGIPSRESAFSSLNRGRWTKRTKRDAFSDIKEYKRETMQKSERDKAKWKILMHRVETRDHCKRNISRLMLSLIVVKKT